MTGPGAMGDGAIGGGTPVEGGLPDILLPATASPAERIVLALGREALLHEERDTRRTHASALYVASPGGTITVESIAATPEGLVRFEGQLHSRAPAALVTAPEAVSVAFVSKPQRDLRVAERNIGRRVLDDLRVALSLDDDGKKARKRAKRAAKMLKKATRNAERAKKAAGAADGPRGASETEHKA